LRGDGKHGNLRKIETWLAKRYQYSSFKAHVGGLVVDSRDANSAETVPAQLLRELERAFAIRSRAGRPFPDSKRETNYKCMLFESTMMITAVPNLD
jgi:hypothetical protein